MRMPMRCGLFVAQQAFLLSVKSNPGEVKIQQ